MLRHALATIADAHQIAREAHKHKGTSRAMFQGAPASTVLPFLLLKAQQDIMAAKGFRSGLNPTFDDAISSIQRALKLLQQDGPERYNQTRRLLGVVANLLKWAQNGESI